MQLLSIDRNVNMVRELQACKCLRIFTTHLVAPEHCLLIAYHLYDARCAHRKVVVQFYISYAYAQEKSIQN